MLKKAAIFCIEVYQRYLSPDSGPLKKAGVWRGSVCVFYPTCSEYTKQAVERYGVMKGLWKGLRRILRCHPWQKNRFDPLI